MRLLLPIFLVFGLAVPSVGFGFSGNDWNKASINEQRAYVAGVVDAWQNYSAFDNARASIAGSTFLKASDCLQPTMTYNQIHAIAKYVAENPQRWHEGMAGLTWDAIHRICPK